MKGKRQRLDKAIIQRGTKRPSVFLAQQALASVGMYAGDIDGWAGKGTHDAICKFQVDKMGLQAPDGKIGINTWSALLPLAYASGFKPELWKRCQAMISYFEVGSRQDAYGAAGAIDDGAGCNYGVAQHNALGSVARILRMVGRNDLLSAYNAHNAGGRNPAVLPQLATWFGSVEGIKAQDDYFRRTTWAGAMSIMDRLEVFNEYKDDPFLRCYYERAIALCCDSMIQNEAMWSPSQKPFWRSLTESESKVPRYVELYEGNRWDEKLSFRCSYEELKVRWTEIEAEQKKEHGDSGKARSETNRLCMLELIKRIRSPELRLFIVGQMRARSSSPRWWEDVESRRMVSALGVGKVHGTEHNIQDDWGIGVEADSYDYQWDESGANPEYQAMLEAASNLII